MMITATSTVTLQSEEQSALMDSTDKTDKTKSAEQLLNTYGDRVIRLSDADAYVSHLTQGISAGHRSLTVLSNNLASKIWDQQAIIDAVSSFARKNRYSNVQILLQDASSLSKRTHRLVALSQKLTTSITIKVLNKDIEPVEHGYTIIDGEYLIYFNNENALEGFANYTAAAESKSLMEEFERLWDYCSHADPDLAQLFI